ncbi:MAG: zinc-ribbon domain-containing protein [Pseudomonadales bacterium]|nr:zinc-ribbon domain-containing protein [Pseudomonadales bacterium]
MEEQLLTKCPHCGTTFRLSKEHLEIAGGAVRCGSCYQVFHAKEHIIKTSVVEEVREEPPKEEVAPDPFEEFELDDGDPYEETPNWSSDDHPDADLFSESYAEPTDDATLQEFGIEPEPEEPPKKAAKDGADESWAEALLEEMGEEPAAKDEELIQDDPEEDNAFKSNTGFGGISSSGSAFVEDEPFQQEEKDDFSDTFMDLNYDSFNKFGVDEPAEETSNAHNDESWAQKMLEELESEDAPKAPSIEELSIIDESPDDLEEKDSPFAAREVSRNKEDAVAQAREKAREEAKRQRELEKQNKKTAPEETAEETEISDDSFFCDLSGDLGSDLTDDIDLGDMGGLITSEHSPLPMGLNDEESVDGGQDILEQQLAVSEIHFGDEEAQKKRSGLKTVSLVALNILAIFGLGIQHAYFNFDELARQDQYRPYYQAVCQQLGCKLPTLADISKIQGANLVVRSHPMEPNAIVIDMIVYNRAKYAQPYPDLKLSFEDLNGNPVASRRFKPNEYIQDKKIDFERMPSNAPVHITLEIVDPGPKASNYQVDFLPQSENS